MSALLRIDRAVARARAPFAVAATLLTVLLGSLGCASSDAKLRREAPDLDGGVWREEALHCSRGRCQQLFRLVVEKPGSYVVEATAPSDPLLPDFYVVLEDAEGRPIGDDREAQKRPRRIARKLEPGLYFVRVAGQQKKGEQLSYRLRAKEQVTRTRRSSRSMQPKRTHRATPPPPPAPVFVESEVLEVERDGGEPVAILIEAGTSAGLAPGQSGELVEAGNVIGRIEIVDVYAAGSRARIVGGLRAPITLDTRVRVQK